MKILVTGGAGYIGSHTCVQLLNKGYEVVIVDNFYNSSIEAVYRIEELSGKKLACYETDIRDEMALREIFLKEKPHGVIHFAGLKAVGESVAVPLKYYETNIVGTSILCKVMSEMGVKNIIFSSSATVYGDPLVIPITEDSPKGICTNPYGWTKWILEQMLTDLQNSDRQWNVVILRYFNPVGAHKSGCMGEDPKGLPNNLMPYISQVAVAKLEVLSVYGDDYDTPDGTGVRDYIHVEDLADGHIKALKKFDEKGGVYTYNLGTGNGYSVLDVVQAFGESCGKEVPYVIKSRRKGDIATCYCNPQKAYDELGWTANLGIKEMCDDTWNWQSKNPNGYN